MMCVSVCMQVARSASLEPGTTALVGCLRPSTSCILRLAVGENALLRPRLNHPIPNPTSHILPIEPLPSILLHGIRIGLREFHLALDRLPPSLELSARLIHAVSREQVSSG